MESKKDEVIDIVCFDTETTFSFKKGVAKRMIEFGGIRIHGHTLVQLESWETLIWSDEVTKESVKVNQITHHMLESAPKFSEVADQIFTFLNGRVWMGYNSEVFDTTMLKEEFERLNRPCPVPHAQLDLLPLFRSHFGKRAGNLKLASLATYFGLGQEKHRALDDAKLTLDIGMRVAFTLFVEEKTSIHLGSGLVKQVPRTTSSDSVAAAAATSTSSGVPADKRLLAEHASSEFPVQKRQHRKEEESADSDSAVKALLRRAIQLGEPVGLTYTNGSGATKTHKFVRPVGFAGRSVLCQFGQPDSTTGKYAQGPFNLIVDRVSNVVVFGRPKPSTTGKGPDVPLVQPAVAALPTANVTQSLASDVSAAPAPTLAPVRLSNESVAQPSQQPPRSQQSSAAEGALPSGDGEETELLHKLENLHASSQGI